MSGDSVRVASPLFPVEGQGSIPMSPLQFEIKQCDRKIFKTLNKKWHSRLPLMGSFYINSVFFCAEYKNIYYAVAGWSAPIAPIFNMSGLNNKILELRRMAISSDAPKNTASRMISIMTKIIKNTKPNIYRLISYQDTEVHTGTIYKASGWKIGAYYSGCRKDIKGGSWHRPNAKCSFSNKPKNRPDLNKATEPKIRWEKQIRQESETKVIKIKPPKKTPQKGLFF